MAEPPGTVRSKRTRIHQGLVGRRDLVGSRYLADSELRQEYAAEIAPRTRAALARIFERVELRAPRRVLDLGAGTGAAGEAVRARWGEAVELVAVDRVGGPGMVVADVTRSGRPPGVEGRFDLITAAHLLNELDLDVDGRASLVAGWCVELLAPAGSCIVVEPALRETSRALLEVRDRLLARRLQVVAPCLGQGPCPALANPRDWCHCAAPAIVPGRSRVDFSYLVLSTTKSTVDGRPSTAETRENDGSGFFRVCSDPMKDKGRLRFFVCGAAGRFLLVRLDRDRAAANRQLDRIERGDLVRLEGAGPDAGTLRVGQATLVSRAG